MGNVLVADVVAVHPWRPGVPAEEDRHRADAAAPREPEIQARQQRPTEEKDERVVIAYCNSTGVKAQGEQEDTSQEPPRRTKATSTCVCRAQPLQRRCPSRLGTVGVGIAGEVEDSGVPVDLLHPRCDAGRPPGDLDGKKKDATPGPCPLCSHAASTRSGNRFDRGGDGFGDAVQIAGTELGIQRNSKRLAVGMGSVLGQILREEVLKERLAGQ